GKAARLALHLELRASCRLDHTMVSRHRREGSRGAAHSRADHGLYGARAQSRHGMGGELRLGSRDRMKTAAELKAEILDLTRAYSALTHGANRPGYEEKKAARPFVPGETLIPYAGRVF